MKDLERAVIGSQTKPGFLLELVITIEDKGLILRDLATYLRVVDGFYGQVQRSGYLSYVRHPNRHLRISKVTQGSLDFVIQQILETATNPSLILVWLALKYLPNVIKASADVARAYRDIEEGRLARLNRQRIRTELRQNEALQKLDSNRIRKLCVLLDGLFATEHRRIGGAIRFAQKHVKGVTLTLKKPDKHQK